MRLRVLPVKFRSRQLTVHAWPYSTFHRGDSALRLDSPIGPYQDAAVRIDDEHFRHLVRHGYAVVPGILATEELAAPRANMLRYYPTPEELAATPERYGWIHDDREHLQIEFPFAGDALNQISTHPDLIDAVERLLGTRDVLLSLSAIWAKYAGTGAFGE